MENPFTCTIVASRPDGETAPGVTAMPSQLAERIAALASEGADWVVVSDGSGILYEGPSDAYADWVAEDEDEDEDEDEVVDLGGSADEVFVVLDQTEEVRAQ